MTEGNRNTEHTAQTNHLLINNKLLPPVWNEHMASSVFLSHSAETGRRSACCSSLHPAAASHMFCCCFSLDKITRKCIVLEKYLHSETLTYVGDVLLCVALFHMSCSCPRIDFLWSKDLHISFICPVHWYDNGFGLNVQQNSTYYWMQDSVGKLKKRYKGEGFIYGVQAQYTAWQWHTRPQRDSVPPQQHDQDQDWTSQDLWCPHTRK